MAYTALLVVHVCAASVALIAGFGALLVRKGFGRHRMTGNVFSGAMVVMTCTAVVLASVKSEMIDVVAGAFTFYLVATGWLAVRRVTIGAVELGLLLLALAVAAAAFGFGWEAAHDASGTTAGVPAVPYFVFAAVALMAAGLDASLFRRGVLVGGQRIARHVWRMGFAMLFTATSFFMPTRFSLPDVIMRSHLNDVPIAYVVVAMLYWLARVLLADRKRAKAHAVPGLDQQQDGYALGGAGVG